MKVPTKFFKQTIELSSEEIEFVKKHAAKKGITVEQFMKESIHKSKDGEDLSPSKFRTAKIKIFEKFDKTLKKLADL